MEPKINTGASRYILLAALGATLTALLYAGDSCQAESSESDALSLHSESVWHGYAFGDHDLIDDDSDLDGSWFMDGMRNLKSGSGKSGKGSDRSGYSYSSKKKKYKKNYVTPASYVKKKKKCYENGDEVQCTG
mmetsp:Transcript_21229/g.24916  ORF Transcript_21229/g.24916 Transcript_21229/m.24916 type:complete len:133 (-) Transcript_21229:75-473(-)